MTYPHEEIICVAHTDTHWHTVLYADQDIRTMSLDVDGVASGCTILSVWFIDDHYVDDDDDDNISGDGHRHLWARLLTQYFLDHH